MKKRIAGLLTAIAMMATGAASMGCAWFMFDEPDQLNVLCD